MVRRKNCVTHLSHCDPLHQNTATQKWLRPSAIVLKKIKTKFTGSTKLNFHRITITTTAKRSTCGRLELKWNSNTRMPIAGRRNAFIVRTLNHISFGTKQCVYNDMSIITHKFSVNATHMYTLPHFWSLSHGKSDRDRQRANGFTYRMFVWLFSTIQILTPEVRLNILKSIPSREVSTLLFSKNRAHRWIETNLIRAKK